MTRLARIFAALAVLAAPSAASAATQHISWGLETWQCGQNNYQIRIGSGQVPVWMTNITGLISASAGPQGQVGTVPRSATDPTPVIPLQRQALVTLTSDAMVDSAVDGAITGSPTIAGNRFTQSLDENYYSADIKQTGFQVVHVPVQISFPGGIELPAGQLDAVINMSTYNGSADVQNDCLDTEVHLTVFYTYTAPTS